VKFIANVFNQSKQKETIEIDEQNKYLAILKLKKEGYLILEIKELTKENKVLSKLESKPVWTERYIQNMKYFVGFLLVISFISPTLLKEEQVKTNNYTSFSSSSDKVKKDKKLSYKSSSAESKPKKNISSIKYKQQVARRGEVNYSLVSTLKASWQAEGWKYKSKIEQSQALALMIELVRMDSKSPADTKATLDYIEDNISYW